MLKLITSKKFSALLHWPLMAMLLIFSACLPQDTPALKSANNVVNPPDSNNSNFPDPIFPLPGIFITERGEHTSSNFSVPANFNDSFELRGKIVSQYLRTLPSSTKLCIVSKFNFGNSDRFLVLSAKIQTKVDFSNKTAETLLRIEPNNAATNQIDCLNYNLSQKLLNSSLKPAPTLHSSLTGLCQDCTSLVTGSGFVLYFANGEEVGPINTQALILSLTQITSGDGQACFESSLCLAQGFDCCMDGNCVKNRSERPGAAALTRYQTAMIEVGYNPARYTFYPEIFYVCGENSGVPGGGTPQIDPVYEAQKRLRELKHTYDCINKVDGDFSHCTVTFENAHEKMGTNFTSLQAVGDINFSSINPNFNDSPYKHNIYRIVYAGEVVYDQMTKTDQILDSAFSNTNDVLDQAEAVNLNLSLPNNAKDSTLYLTYKVDGTCERVSSTKAKCTKTFIHNMGTGPEERYSSFWHSNSQEYYLPGLPAPYADFSSDAIISISVNGIKLFPSGQTWEKGANKIIFHQQLLKGQKIEITYNVISTRVSSLLSLKDIARSKVNSICACDSSSRCNLKPIIAQGSNEVVNYECIYESADDGTPPVNQTVNITSKHVPQRYFDVSGVAIDENHGSAQAQEGNEFEYLTRNLLRPNNISTSFDTNNMGLDQNKYIGFNEINGSFAALAGQDTQPAKMIRVKKDTTYDILANGSFTPCSGCGSDYYGNQPLFPFDPSGKAGGYTPDKHASSRTSNTGLYRADDLLFGRACFVPATMIPWTHTAAVDVKTQRKNRLAAQHFLFANGYNKDWYGFDYGSVIGSFDGVTWFSIGSTRRIKAKSSRLYLAVNTYAGDLNGTGSFQISVSEKTLGSSIPIPEKDSETDGAQCQSMHTCSTENDCYAQLGYDYSCETVSSIQTNWPVFDNNAAELISDPSGQKRSLTSIIGGIQGSNKRCVYRGRGAPCETNLAAIPDTNNTFNSSPYTGTQMCSPNTYCAPLTSPKFNSRIVRFGKSPALQNNSTYFPSKTDTHGLGARILLRPYDYLGSKLPENSAKVALVGHKVNSVCIPGKNIAAATDIFQMNSLAPSSPLSSSDKILGVGTTSPNFNLKSMNACPAVDHAGNDIHDFNLNLNDPSLRLFTISQNLSTKLLDLSPLRTSLFPSLANPLDPLVKTTGYQQNACLRAPGAACFTDMECAPSSFIASKVKAANLASILNSAEIKYWSEELVCGNSEFKQVGSGVLNPDYDPKKNVCCRNFGNTFSVFTETATSDYKWCTSGNEVQVAGVNVDFQTPSRYSRVNTAFDKLTCNLGDSTKSFALSLNVNGAGTPDAKAGTRLQQILTQYKTLSTVNERTCCTKNWVRQFSTENGGGNAFTKGKLQNIDKFMFRNLNWLPQNLSLGVNDTPFNCTPQNYGDITCEVKNFTQSEEDKYLTWAASLELVGIPQVAIGTNEHVFKLVDDEQKLPILPIEPLTDSNDRLIFEKVATALPDFKDSETSYYSAASYSKLNMDDDFSTSKNSLKKVFSESEFKCCIPTGQEVPSSTTVSQCCTGALGNVGGPLRCCLPDYTDVTLYLNRYVSSQGAGLPDSAYDPKTGYIKDPMLVQTIAAQKNICCSGKVATGVAVSRLLKPMDNLAGIPINTLSTTRRLIFRDDIVDDNTQTGSVGTNFEKGLRWNNHLYCVP